MNMISNQVDRAGRRSLWRGLCPVAMLCIGLGVQTQRASGAEATQDESPPLRPNVLMVMADDMGYGDYSMAGHPDLKTPALDAMATRSAQFTSFYVLPVCGLTRAALMSGRYPHRVGVHINGRELRRGTPTIASDLQAAGYATGIFGKWHLGDHYPSRPVDFGFEKSVVSRGGIIGQLADTPNEVRYTDPFLMHDGKRQAFKGYATDVHFEQALDWIEKVHAEGRPFFAFLSPNVPHKPYDDVPPEEYEGLRAELLAKARSALQGNASLGAKEIHELDQSARYYAMLERLDANIGRMFERLGKNGLLEQTLVLFFSDNGPVPGRYNAGLRGGKGQVHEGGIKTRFFAHWPGKLSPSLRSDRIAAHIDLLPTLLDACGVELLHTVDGISLWPILTGASDGDAQRTLLFEAHQGSGAARQNYAVRSQDYKLVMAGGYSKRKGSPRLELYDMRVDPLEANDLAGELPDVVSRLNAEYDDFAQELKLIFLATRRNELRIEVGAKSDHPQWISREHWRRTQAGSLSATWQLLVTDPGSYSLRMIFDKAPVEREVMLTLNRNPLSTLLPAEQDSVSFEDMQLSRGANFVDCNVVNAKGALMPAWQMEIIRTGDLKAIEDEDED